VKYVLEGSVQKSPDRIRIGVELVDASSGTELWTQKYDRPLKDIFAVQDEIAGKVVTTLGLIFKLEEMKAPHSVKLAQTDNLEAYDDLLRANQYWSRFTKEDHLRARQWVQKAIELDPKYAQAYAFLGGNYSSSALFGWSEDPAADLAHAYELNQKALTLDDSNSVALADLCEIDWMQKQFDRAVAECERAVANDPNFVGGYVSLADALTAANKAEEAVRAAEKATRLDPLRADFYAYFIASPYVLMGRYQEAIPLLKRHIAVYPGQPWAHIMLAISYIELGHDQEARAEAAEAIRMSPGLVYRDVNQDAAVNKRLENDLHKAGLK